MSSRAKTAARRRAYAAIRAPRRGRRGAALVIVIAIMTILLAIALTFFRITRQESQVATNVSNIVRVDLQSDAAIAIAIAQLNQDVLRHPGATSLDHAWRSTFNGAWVAGKPWALRNRVALQAGGVPEVDLEWLRLPDGTRYRMPDILFADDWREPLYRGQRTRQWLYIPRIEGDLPVIYAPVGSYVLLDPDTDDDVTNTFPHGTFPVDSNGNIDRTSGDYRRFVTAAIHSTVDGGIGDGYAAEQIDEWTDIDNDGDGLRDSLWIPIPIDKMLTYDHYARLWGIDNDLDGLVGGYDLNGDGVDDDPNEAGPFVYWGGADGLDNDGDGLIDQGDTVITSPNATVEYVAGLDDPDNPPLALPAGNSNLGFFLTAPLPGLVIPIDADGDGIPGNEDLNADGFDDQMVVRVPDEIFVRLMSGVNRPVLTIRLTEDHVDTIDNDYDLIANDYFTYAYLGSQVSAPPRFAYSDIVIGDDGDTDPFVINRADLLFESQSPAQVANLTPARYNALRDGYAASIHITHSGEPVCDLAGRAAVLINDESSKVNANIAGGHHFFDDAVVYPVNNIFASGNDFQDVVDSVVQRSLADGAGTYEYETRTLPTARAQVGNFGAASARRMWSALMGTPDTDPTNFDNALLADYRWDAFLPGYGRADDNGNAFLSCFNGRDDDGDGLVDEGLYLPPLTFWTHAYVTNSDDYQSLDANEQQVVRNAALMEMEENKFAQYFNRLGLFEGVDEPGELQRFRPLRNLIAEGIVNVASDTGNRDLVDNDDDGVVNEFGELGDRQLQNREQLAAVYQFGDVSVSKLLPFVTTHSTDRNVTYVNTDAGLRAVNRLDLNHAPPQQIAASLMVEGEFTPITERGVSRPGNSITSDLETLAFAEGLRQGDTHLASPRPRNNTDLGGGFLHAYDEVDDIVFPSAFEFPADPQLQAMQMAVDMVDNRDADNSRSTLTTERADLLADDIKLDGSYPEPWPAHPGDLNAREAIPRDELMPLEEVQEYAKKTLDIGSASGADKRLEITDGWWEEITKRQETNSDGVTADVYEEQHISYTMTGAEAIRINELMVRPVRRVEAEMIAEAASDGDSTTSAMLDPAPYNGMPLFSVASGAIGPAGNILDTPAVSWTRSGSILGSSSAWIQESNPAGAGYLVQGNQGDVTVPDVAQFVFRTTDPMNGLPKGLPPGRYYLTADGSVNGDAPGPVKSQLVYSIKYIDVANGGPTILDDILTLKAAQLSAGTPAALLLATNDWLAYGAANWQGLPAEHVASRLGEPAGKMFLDGTPILDPDDQIRPVPTSGYFGEWPPAASFILDDGVSDVEAWGRIWLTDPLTDADQDGYDDVTFEGVTIEFRPYDLAVVVDDVVTLRDPVTGFTLNVPMDGVVRLSYTDNDTTAYNAILAAFLAGRLEAVVEGADSDGNAVTLGSLAVNDPAAHQGDYQDYTTNTVSIPRWESGYALCVAIENPNNYPIDASTGQQLAIDRFEFSQEPDHEYIELVNVSDDPVNVSNWELEVGIPDRPGVLQDPFKSSWYIPNGTVVAPRGTVLLSFEGNRDQTTEARFDRYHAPLNVADVNKIASNGIGVAAGGTFGGDSLTNFLDVTDISVPPIFDTSRAYDATDTAGLGVFYDPSGSVFDRPNITNATSGFDYYRDYVDNNGDGVTTAPYVVPQRVDLLDQNVVTDAQQAQLDRDMEVLTKLDSDDVMGEDEQLTTSGGTSSSGSKPWDRIVSLRSNRLEIDPGAYPYDPGSEIRTLFEVTNVDDVARIVLRGGVLPNYPERDGIDNDGDGGYFAIDTGRYVRGPLEKDMVDNDLDGIVDEGPIPVDIDNADGILDIIAPDPSLSEGVDEGNLRYPVVEGVRRYGAGSFELMTLPARFFVSRGDYQTSRNEIDSFIFNNGYVQFDGDGNPTDISAANYFAVADTGLAGLPVVPSSEAETAELVRTLGYDMPADVPNDLLVYSEDDPDPYLGSDVDPPDWKAFVERRWYPGDNVIVTLYEGPASQGHVADRVTYRELDVTNRTIDDIVTNPYFIDDGDGDYESGTDTWLGLNDAYPGLWAPDQMGLDFYRALERKHPLYNGDRFGTENRWQATDGNYDDWADSLSWFENWLQVDDPDAPVTRYVRSDDDDTSIPFMTARLATSANALGKRFNGRLFGHAMQGSPLRMNTAQRLSENPKDVIKALDLDVDAYGYTDPLRNRRRDDQFPGIEDTPDWSHAKAVVKNRRFESPGELVRLPHLMVRHTMVNPIDVETNALFRRVLDATQLNLPFIWPSGAIGEAVVTPQDPYFSNEVALLGQDEVDSANVGNLLTHAVDITSFDNTVLTVGQADFTPLNPGMASYSNGADFGFDVDWLEWGLQADSGVVISTPVAWTPVFLFGLAGDGLPNYPSYPDGRDPGVTFDPVPLFDVNFQSNKFPTATNPFAANMFVDEMAARWPLDRRAIMYVSENDGVADAAEALFTWDGADGLENGEYILYIGTYTPDLAERVDTARDALGGGVLADLVDAGVLASPPAEDFVYFDDRSESLLDMDPALAPSESRRFDPQLAVQVITDPAKASGMVWPADDPSWDNALQRRNAVGLTHPDSWPADETSALPVGSDGYIFYGNSLWQPIPVQVRDNFLGLRVRNVGGPNQVAVLSHVVLAPRKRVPGRINVNTVADRTPQRDSDSTTKTLELWNALLGLPPLVNAPEGIEQPDDLATVDYVPGPRITYTSPLGLLDTDTPTNATLLPRPGQDPDIDAGTVGTFLTNWPVPLRRQTPYVDFDSFTGEGGGAQDPVSREYLLFGEELITRPTGLSDEQWLELRRRYAAQRLSNLMVYGRQEHVDGRYYEKAADLARDASGFVPPQVEAEYFQEGNLDLANSPGELSVYPLSNEGDSERRFDEVAERFRRMANLITTRSDVFEIIVTVQAGYGVDVDGNGWYNYRDAEEFVVTAENKTRLVYERRSPSDQTGRPRD